MLFVTLTDTQGKRVQVNTGTVAWFGPDAAGKGTLITFAVTGESGALSLRVAEAPDDIFAQINAKLRR
jgi:hypothetical protein